MIDKVTRGWRDPSVRTWGLAAVLAAAGLALASVAGSAPLVPSRLPGAPFVICLVFAAAEIGYVSVEHRRQTYSFTMAGVPLVLGLLFLPLWQVMAARLAAAVVVLAFQRLPTIKMAYNLAAFTFETALAGAFLHLLPVRDTSLSLVAAGCVYVAVAVIDLLMSSLVLLLMHWHGTRLGRRRVHDALVPAAAFNAVALAYALIAVVLLEKGSVGWVLLAALSVVAFSGYRAHTVLAARHSALAEVNRFVEEEIGTQSVEGLAGHRLAKVREFLRAGSAKVVLRDAANASCLILAVDEHNELSVEMSSDGTLDWLHSRVIAQDDALLLPRRVKDAGLRRWLSDNGAKDAVVVPLLHGDSWEGTLSVTDRLSDHATFTVDDLTLLRTLAGHLGVALRSTRLLDRLRYDATHDTLTGLANRALLLDRLGEALTSDDAAFIAVMFLDLNGFKEVNDTLGHEMGDRLLEVVGRRLLEAVPDGSLVSRLGGDEFAVLLRTGFGDATTAVAEQLALHVRERVAAPVQLDEAVVSVDASLGIATTENAGTATDLLRHADTAMYAAKGAGVPVVVYTAELDRGRAERLALVADLRLALERDELTVLYQPKLDTRTHRVTSAEALVRWRHPRLGMLSPDTFIPIAESTGLIEGLTHQVLEKALIACRTWSDAGLDIQVAVNLSAKNLASPQLPQQITAALAAAGLPAGALILEITESSVMEDPEATVRTLDQLVSCGVTISLDDFGTGYSSLAYLQRLPVQEVKIDRSFVVGLSMGSDSSEKLIRSIAALGHSFGLKVVAEGVEDESTFRQLAVLGCDTVQGYLISRPVSAASVLGMGRRFTILVPERRIPTPRGPESGGHHLNQLFS